MFPCNKRRVKNIFMYVSFALYLACITGYMFLSYFENSQECLEKRVSHRLAIRNTSDYNLNILGSEWSNSTHIMSGQSYRRRPELHYSTNIVKPLKLFRCRNWAVDATVSNPTYSIRLILSDSKWCIIIVADISSKSKDNYISELGYSGERLVFLEPQDQEKLYPDLSRAIPWNQYGRKNIGYMFAIHNGAELIWDFDDTNQGLFDINIIRNQTTMRILKRCKGSFKVFNPYPYFGANESYIWPRGFPLQFVHETATLPGLCVGDISVKEVGVIQSIANIEPDVDAIYRLMRPRTLVFEATKAFPFILVPRFSYCPFNAHATLWTKSSFLYMALPTSIHSRVSDIWRSYIAQFFFHKTKTNILFSPPYVFKSNSKHFDVNLESEIDMYQKAGKLVDFLHTFSPGINTTLETLYRELFKRGHIGLRDINFIKLWIKAYNEGFTSN